MHVGLALPIANLDGGPHGPGSLARAACAIEDAGFASMWTFDAMGRGFFLPDPLSSLAIAAGSTNTLALGTGVLQLPVRSMIEVASRVLTLSAEVGDRLTLGVGPGSTPADFALFDVDFATRFERFEHQLRELRVLLSEGAIGNRVLVPTPPRRSVAIGLAGWRGPWIERAAREADAWIASGFHASDDELAEGIARYRVAGGTRAVVTNVRVGREIEPAGERVALLGETGFDEVILMDPTPSRQRVEMMAMRLDLSADGGA